MLTEGDDRGAVFGEGGSGFGEIVLRVKSASHPSTQDLEFNVSGNSSVGQIKETIRTLSSQHPEIKEQRLIYAGHLLDDNQVLKDVLSAKAGSQFNPELPVTVHLACTSKYINPSSLSSKTTAHKPTGEQGTNPPQPNNPQGFVPNFTIPQNMGVPEQDIPQDVMSLHQAYVEQMAAYMNQWYAQQGVAMGGHGMLYQIPLGNAAPQPAGDMFPPPNVNEQPAAAPPPARGLDEDDRDFLDWAYTFSRVILIFSVVYFYSSFSRFILVVMFTGLVMILQRRQNVDANAGEAADNANQPAPQQAQAGNVENEGENGNPEANEPNAEQQQPLIPPTPTPPRRNIPDIAWTFLTTFFTSLIPENYHNQ